MKKVYLLLLFCVISIAGYAQTITYSEAFVSGVAPSSQCASWTTFRAALVNTNQYTGFTISGSMNPTGISCTDPVVAAAVANALNTGTPYTGSSDAQTWSVNIGGCTTPVCGPLYVELTNQGSCSCTSGYAVRPTINNSNWGGINGTTCSAASQTMTVTFTTTVYYVNGSPQALQTCSGVASSIDALLMANDLTGSTETWSLFSGPTNGTISGLPATAASGMGVMPSGVSYTPTAGYSGTDAFTIQVSNGTTSALTTINVTVNPLPTLVLGAIPAVCAGGTSTTLPFSGATDAISNSTVLSYTGGAQTWTVPAGVTSIVVDAQGAGGGMNSDEFNYPSRGGYGGRVQATLAVTPGQVLNIYVGGQGGTGISLGSGIPGYNGGGNSGFSAPYAGGGGGGATDIRIGGIALTDRVLVAGGGGGAGLDCPTIDLNRGGDGGGTTAEDGIGACNGGNGGGGTPSAGGFAGVCGGCSGTAGTAGTFGIGGSGAISGGGGGGGGYYGGGSGQWDGAGGGSSYTDPVLASSVTHTQGYNTAGNGQITITYSIPTTYNITWDPGAISAGFIDVINNPVSSSPINVAVPGAAPANTYTGNFTITNSNTTCTSLPLPLTLTINPIPDVAPVGSQAVCNNAATTAINFSGTVPGTSFDWVNSDPTIGIGASGSGDIGSFIATNTDPALPVVAVLTVTPSYLGCVGTPQVFSITVNPTPSVDATANQTYCNGETAGPFNFTGPVAGTTFSWINTETSIGLAASGLGDIGAFTATNTTVAPVSAFITVNSSANGCTGTSNSFTIVVNPTPILTSSLNPPAICDNTMFSYTPTSATSGTTFDWSRDTVTGISNLAAMGSDDPAEVLLNTTPNPIIVTYVYTLTANGCTNVQNVSVVVNPTPMLSSTLTPPAICDSTAFNYVPASLTPGTTYSWSRATVAGISNAAGSGTGTINEILINTTPNPVVVTYVDTLTANGCMNTQNIPVTVNPKPLLSSPSDMSPVCDGSHVFYNPASLTTGTTFNWSRSTFAGLINPAASGADTISEVLNDTSAFAVNVIYVYTLTANGCSASQNVGVVVYPTPKLSSSLTPPAICDGNLFNYTPLSRTPGAMFTWDRAFVIGIGQVAASGSGNPNEELDNNTNDNLNVVYVYTITANGCTHTQNVTVMVHPTPTLSSSLANNVCSGTNFHYVPTGFVFGTTFTWTRAHVAGITPATKSGNGTIDEVLTDSALIPINTSYVFTLTANGCTHIESIAVVVNPVPPVAAITTYPPANLCSNTMYQNFGAAGLPPAGQNYHWTAQNATVWATGAHGQYALVNFNTPGTATVTLVSNLSAFTCVTNNTYTVNVGTGVSDAPQVVYFTGQLICLQTDEDSYQWGYDDGITLDSTLLVGENNPNYFVTDPNVTGRYYWVITKRGDCMQKSYYRVPTGITNINSEVAEMKVYPNPTSEMVNVEINTTQEGNYEVRVLNLLGQNLEVAPMANHKASINVARLASGIYLVDCYRNGVKVATQRFIKN
jgi:hypothetical protein